MTNQNAPADTMTIRQRFVMAAMQGLRANPSYSSSPDGLAGDAIAIADDMLAEEARTRGEQ